MTYWVRAILGLAVFGAGLAALNYSLYELMQIGTCATGGPYVSARPCPDGTIEKGLLLPAGLAVAGIGIGIYAARGRRSGAPDGARGIGAGLVGWSGLFVSIGVVALMASVGPGADPDQDAKWVGIFLCAMFVPMGLVPLVAAVLGRRALRRAGVRLDPADLAARAMAQASRARASVAHAAPVYPARAAGGDPVDRLRKLGELRDSGVLTVAEFDAAKARILAEL